MVKKPLRSDQVSKRGGWRPGAGRKRKSPGDRLTSYANARIPLDLHKAINRRVKRDKTNRSDVICRALEMYLRPSSKRIIIEIE